MACNSFQPLNGQGVWIPLATKDKESASKAVWVFPKVMQLTVSNTKSQLPMDSLLLTWTCILVGALLMLVGVIFPYLALQVARNGKIAFKLFPVLLLQI